jgi:DAK2 domain fusion protein YloV
MSAAVTELNKKQPSSVDSVAEVTASALLRGARGNSGVILSLLFRGMAKSLKGKTNADALDLAQAMTEGVDVAYKAVMKPTEGTILTVSRMAASSAMEFAQAGSDVELMLVCALESAKDALAETINQNPVLKRAGVIDAGGQGYVVILDAMLASLQGRAIAAAKPVEKPIKESADFSSFKTEDITFAYCTEFIISRSNEKSPDLLRAFLETLGDSVVVVDDDEIIKTHIHTNQPGQVITEALTYGPLLTVKIENMREQHTNLGGESDGAGSPGEAEIAPPEKKYGSVAVCAGEGMEKLFRELGVDRIVTGGQTMNPSTEDILREINQTPAEIVFVFPNNKNIIMAAEQCIPLSEKKIIVIPTKTVPQGVSAMLNMDTYAEEDELVASLNDSVSNVRTALVTYAARDSEFDGHSISAGEYLAMLDGSLIGSFNDFSRLLDKLIETFKEYDPEFISIYFGEEVDEDSAEDVCSTIASHFPDAEVNLINGGQPVYYYMISLE